MKRAGPAIGALLLAAAVLYFWNPYDTRPDSAGAARDRRPEPGRYTLALSWQPAFCETRPDKPECETGARESATGFTLHGLWPEGEYCSVSSADEQSDRRGDWDRLPAPELSSGTRSRLDRLMPGTESLLERHEWIKHGTCSGADADTYFAAALDLTEAVNATPLAKLFSDNQGRDLPAQRIRATLDAALFRGAGQRVQLDCERQGGRQLITELSFALDGDIAGGDLPALLQAAGPVSGGCKQGFVDPGGFRR